MPQPVPHCFRSLFAALAFLLTPLLILLLALLPAGARAANNDPIVLVHGFLGFGPDQFPRSGFLYWGGYGDIAAHLRLHHGPHTVLTASVGAIASNRERAAELYAQIKGGCVDYGLSHGATDTAADTAAEAAGEKKPVRCWAADPARNPLGHPPALYPAWDARHPLHMIGHSQGGTTVRALVELLEHGAPGEGDGELYQGGKVGWVRSVTTISSPHNGTTLRDAVLDILPQLRSPLRDWLEHDLRNWEMAPDGARNFNRWARTSPHIYYFSVGTLATEAGAWCCNGTDRALAPLQSARYQYPRADMFGYYKRFAGEWIVPSMLQRGMGSYTQSAPGRVRIDSAWFANDGVVNTASMRAPAGHPVRDFDGTPVKGYWNFLGNYRGYDHFDILNWPNKGPPADPIYERISEILFAL
ncbi:esterase/lipase family protein [Massilia sp. GCM10023247]|uniref:esterase/lipase family protein n=1 Tax=Massilia sp. GCM10023247 TaxID=3252643 RepID=UPI00361C09E3